MAYWRRYTSTLEEMARTAAHLLTSPVDEDWGVATAVRSGWAKPHPAQDQNPRRHNACWLLERLRRHGSGYRPDPRAEELR